MGKAAPAAGVSILLLQKVLNVRSITYGVNPTFFPIRQTVISITYLGAARSRSGFPDPK
jgi:hypothetical protein